MSSTLLDGFYTQPLGYVLLLLWMLVYLQPQHVAWRFALSALLLALTVLANFFNAITATIFIVCVLAFDLLRCCPPIFPQNLIKKNVVLSP
jgi:hypothetical protein